MVLAKDQDNHDSDVGTHVRLDDDEETISDVEPELCEQKKKKQNHRSRSAPKSRAKPRAMPRTKPRSKTAKSRANSASLFSSTKRTLSPPDSLDETVPKDVGVELLCSYFSVTDLTKLVRIFKLR